jgi:hypothetical protein
MRDIAGVIRQAEDNRWGADASFAAMPADFCQRMLAASVERFREVGAGLLAVHYDQVKVIVPATHERQSHPCSQKPDRVPRNVWRRLDSETHEALSSGWDYSH